ncbi:uncharacterized protein [Dermacentor albipictus]|uniref:uncharacterized protein n=1 Tax=Dermacentor albipictus TaxID=60249 RepID=UPI0031FBAAF2
MILETHSEETPRLPDHRSHDSPLSKRDTSKGKGRGACTFVRKGITFMEHKMIGRSAIELCTVEVITGKKRKESTFVVNVYSNLSHGQQKFKALFHKASSVAGSNTLIVCGDFNAPSQDWGYHSTTVNGRELMQDATDVGLNLITDLAFPTRIGTSVTRDTTPDLTFVKTDGGSREAKWRNTGQELGSDHYMVEVVVLLEGQGNTGIRKHRITDWDAFRKALTALQLDITNIEQWAANVVETTEGATKELETDEWIDKMYSRRAHLIEAKQSIKARWQKRRTNRSLRTKIAELNRQIEVHCRMLCTQQWNEACNEADGQMHKGKTWNMLRHLLDETKTKGNQHNNLARTLHKAICEHGEDEVKWRLDAEYLPTTPTERHPDYQGNESETLDQDHRTWEVRVALQDLNGRSAAGPDRVTNRALKNLNEASTETLTNFYKCWQGGRLPKQWKAAKTILIPKQRYLEELELHPNSFIGFRNKLGMQDAMILLKNEIIDDTMSTKDNRAILTLDLQSAFDKIKDFLTEQTTENCAGDLQLEEKKLGSVGTPQGSVISPLLFNLVMIGLANWLERVAGVRHTIYADDVTLWVPGRSDGHIETTLQEAVNAIEEQLDGSGVICSPAKSELLVIPPRGAGRKRKNMEVKYERPKITVKTAGGPAIPEVEKIRVLGLLIQRS